MKKYLAELIGTFVLVFGGIGAAVLAGSHIGNLGVALAFGFALMIMIYVVGNVSGAHLNPAVSVGMWSSGRMSGIDCVKYAAMQFIGASVAAYTVYLLAVGTPGWTLLSGLGQNGWGLGYGGNYGIAAAMLFEFIATFIFVWIILEVTKTKTQLAGLVIGLSLVLLATAF